MKLRNKKTGEIGFVVYSDKDKKLHIGTQKNLLGEGVAYDSLSKLHDDWEDYHEEPKEYWFIDTYSYEVNYNDEGRNEDLDNFNKEIGNYFETQGEAELAVRKLKAWKRLRSSGFRFEGWYGGARVIHFRIDSLDKKSDYLPHFIDDDMANDLDLLFGGENE